MSKIIVVALLAILSLPASATHIEFRGKQAYICMDYDLASHCVKIDSGDTDESVNYMPR